ncbi:MAG TPA: hypothetical protein VMG59_12885 [Phycisphaerae bacterium]|nr:hypothetical protein [Phycisphaerae bacterium]
MAVTKIVVRRYLTSATFMAFTAGAISSSATISSAAITVDGTYSSDFGGALASQTINTGFGNSSYSAANTNPAGKDANGSELDAAYGVIENGNLYLLFTGNFENNGNHLNIFIADGRTGQSTLSVDNSQVLGAMNGSQFSPNFGHGATYVLDVNEYQGTVYTNDYDLIANTNSYLGAFSVYSHKPNTVGSLAEALNNSNVSQMGTSGAAANQSYVNAVQTGFEVAIPLSALGNPTGSIEVLADINSTQDNYLSNQFLAGLPVGSSNIAVAKFNFSSTPGMFFTIPVPSPTSKP